MYIKVKAHPGSKKEYLTELSGDRFEIGVKEKAEQNHQD